MKRADREGSAYRFEGSRRVGGRGGKCMKWMGAGVVNGFGWGARGGGGRADGVDVRSHGGGNPG